MTPACSWHDIERPVEHLGVTETPELECATRVAGDKCSFKSQPHDFDERLQLHLEPGRPLTPESVVCLPCSHLLVDLQLVCACMLQNLQACKLGKMPRLRASRLHRDTGESRPRGMAE